MSIFVDPPPLRSLTWFDAAALAVLLLLGWSGYRRGALGWVASLGASLLALLAAFALAPAVTPLILPRIGITGVIAERIAFLVVLVVLRFLLGLAMHELVAAIRPVLRALPPLDLLDHLLGVIPSLILGMVLVAVLLVVALVLPVNRRLHDAAAQSYVGRLTLAEVAHATRQIPPGGLLALPAKSLDAQRALAAIESQLSSGKVP